MTRWWLMGDPFSDTSAGDTGRPSSVRLISKIAVQLILSQFQLGRRTAPGQKYLFWPLHSPARPVASHPNATTHALTVCCSLFSHDGFYAAVAPPPSLCSPRLPLRSSPTLVVYLRTSLRTALRMASVACAFLMASNAYGLPCHPFAPR